MNIVVIGNESMCDEAKARLGARHSYSLATSMDNHIDLAGAEVIFDFNSDWNNKSVEAYKKVSAPVFLNSVFSTLEEVGKKIQTQGLVFGFCGMSTFFNRPKIEITLIKDSAVSELKHIGELAGLEFLVVKDQVGMVTPRVIVMIVNEAFEALQQGVASREDIDLSMKLGTNYPFGPFEWADKIGLGSLRRLLINLQVTSSTSRYHANF